MGIEVFVLEPYDPYMAQFHAQVQGIYESLVRKHFKLKSTAPFLSKTGRRLDERRRLSKTKIRKLLGSAFAIATRAGRRAGYIRKGSNQPTKKGMDRAFERQLNNKKLMENMKDYETTLYLARKEPLIRVIEKESLSGKTTSYLIPMLDKRFRSIKKLREFIENYED